MNFKYSNFLALDVLKWKQVNEMQGFKSSSLLEILTHLKDWSSHFYFCFFVSFFFSFFVVVVFFSNVLLAGHLHVNMFYFLCFSF